MSTFPIPSDWGPLLAGGVGPTWADFAFLFRGGQVRVQIAPNGEIARIKRIIHEFPLDFVPDKVEITPYPNAFPWSLVHLHEGDKQNVSVSRSPWLRARHLRRHGRVLAYTAAASGFLVDGCNKDKFPHITRGVLLERVDFEDSDAVVKISYALPNGGVLVARQVDPLGEILVSLHRNKTKQTVPLHCKGYILEGIHPSGSTMLLSEARTFWSCKITLWPRLDLIGPAKFHGSTKDGMWSWRRLGGICAPFTGPWVGEDAWGNSWYVSEEGLITDFRGVIETLPDEEG